MKAYRENRGVTPLILNLSAKWRWVVKFTPRLAGNQRVSQSFGEKKSLYLQQGFEPLDIPASNLVNILAALPCLFLKAQQNSEE